VCLVVVLVMVATPWFVRFGVPEVFARHGVQASVDGGRLDLVRRELILEGFKLGSPDTPALSLDEAGLGFDLASLLRGRVKLGRLRVEGVELDPERLASLTTRRPDGVAISPSALQQNLPVEIGALSFENLRLPFVSERIGHEVLIDQVTIADLDALGNEGKAKVELGAAIDKAPITVRAELVYRDDELSLSGVYRVDGVPLRGWTRLFDEDSDPVRDGVLRGTGELRVDYGFSANSLAATIDGRLTWTGIGLALAPLDAREGDLDWQGRLVLQWQSLDRSPTIRGEGALQAERVTLLTEVGSDEGAEARLADVSWHGSFEWRDGFTADGAVLGTDLHVSKTGSRSPAWQARAEDFSWRLHAVRTASPITLSVRVQDFDMSRGSLSTADGDASGKITLEGIAIDELRAAHTGDFVLGQLDVETLHMEESGATRLASGLKAEGLSGELSGTLQIARLGVSSFDHEGVARSFHAEEIDMASVGYAAPGRLGAAFLSVKSLRIDAEQGAVWLSDLDVVRLHRNTSTDFGAKGLSVAEVFHGGSKNGSWEASKLVLTGLRGAPDDAIHVDSAKLASLLQSGADGSWRGTGMGAADLSVSMDGSLGASRLSMARLDRRQPEKGDLRVTRLDASGLNVSTGVAELDKGAAQALAYRFPNGDRFEGRELQARGLRGELGVGVEVHQLSVASGHGLALDGTQRSAVGLEARSVSVDADGALRLGQGQLTGYRQHGDGVGELGLELLQVLAMSWTPGGELAADSAALHGATLDVDDSTTWKLAELSTEGFRWNGARTLGAARARLGSLWRREGDADASQAQTMEATNLRWRIPGELQAATLAADTIRDGAEPPAWRATGLDAGGLRVSRSRGHRIDTLHTGPMTVNSLDGDAELSVLRVEARALESDVGQTLGAEHLRLDDVRVVSSRPGYPPQFSAGSLAFDGPALHPGGLLDLGHVVAAEPSLTFGQNAHNAWMMPRSPGATDDLGASAGIRLSSFTTRGGGRVEFFDRATDPEFRFVLEPMVLALGELDTSVPGQVTDFRIRGKHRVFAEVSAGGMFTKRVHGFDLSMNAELYGIDMSAFNPYLRRRQGFEATAGRGDGLFDVTIDNGELTGHVKVLLAGMELRRVRETAGGVRTDSSSLSLDVAMALIKDKRGNIEIAFPIAGRVGTPGFDFIETTGEGYYGTVYAAARVAASLPGKTLQRATSVVQRTRSLLPALGSPRYAPVHFAVGSDALSADPMVYLKQLSQRMRRDKTIEVRPCGLAVPGDRAMAGIDDSDVGEWLKEASRDVFPVFGANDEGQLALAARRAAIVREFLRDANEVPAGQLSDCDPGIDGYGTARPRVELDVASPGTRLRFLPRPFTDLLP
jgi:hypothetical protein